MDKDEKAKRDAAVDEMVARARSEPTRLPSLGYTKPAFETPVTQAGYKPALDAWIDRHKEWLTSDAVECYNPFPIPKDETADQAMFRMMMGEIVHRVLLSKLYPEDEELFGMIAPGKTRSLSPWQRKLLDEINASREREARHWKLLLDSHLELRPVRERALYAGWVRRSHGEQREESVLTEEEIDRRMRDAAVDRMLARRKLERQNGYERER